MLDPQESPGEIKSRQVESGSESWTSLASVVPQQLCYGHCPCDSDPHSSSNSNCVPTASLDFPGRSTWSSHSLSLPSSSPFPVSNKQFGFCGLCGPGLSDHKSNQNSLNLDGPSSFFFLLFFCMAWTCLVFTCVLRRHVVSTVLSVPRPFGGC